MRWAGLLTAVAAWTACGCEPSGIASARRAELELPTRQGRWTVRLDRAELTRPVWALRIVDSAISESDRLPRLHRLVLEIENTSTLPLRLLPTGTTIIGLGPDSPLVAGDEPIVLPPREPVQIEYRPSDTQPDLPYPFSLQVRVRLGEALTDDVETVAVELR